ncbi:acetyltransferase (GNAT) family protein [Lutibacter sp. Hel_I_33_5]|uniref:GNAT family N-acetyltransferase n=1 Tax=Lutibacter sp. Hel_I_33_5 TaxID=1566289 RepID=UPI00119CAFEF|nr:GNAT family N-acetyltransferase [Lutibacter sp. Hel_I_33_5]TVZ55075.1 acetyltransferase (GNAT) family protein [Lutibacter sp. Hel_I_33_5]
MRLVLSKTEDIPAIMQIINDAKKHLASQKIDQWQNGYPNQEQIENDILKKRSHVVKNDENQVIATSMFTVDPEPTYKTIEGDWVIDEKETYGVIHRLAIKSAFRKNGIAQFIFNEFHQQLKDKNIKSLKIDTHEENTQMQALIKKLGYQYCGIIYTSYNAKRLAFEKVISF